ncbi:hypothetical protein RYX56_23135, partial [Alkalihalophilus lindianensis]
RSAPPLGEASTLTASKGSITEQVAASSTVSAGPAEAVAAGEAARPDVSEVIAAFTSQFAGAERRNLEMLL